MVSGYEASMLQRYMRHELAGSGRVVEKCVAGLLLLAAVAVFGARPASVTLQISDVDGPVLLAAYDLTPRLDWE